MRHGTKEEDAQEGEGEFQAVQDTGWPEEEAQGQEHWWDDV